MRYIHMANPKQENVNGEDAEVQRGHKSGPSASFAVLKGGMKTGAK
jgi:hypothetical protein